MAVTRKCAANERTGSRRGCLYLVQKQRRADGYTTTLAGLTEVVYLRRFTALFTMVSRSGAAAALCVAAARRPTRTSAWQNTPPASSVPVRARSPGLARAEVAGGAFWCDPFTPSSIVGSPCGRDARSAAAG